MKVKLFICLLLALFGSIALLSAANDVEKLRRLFVEQVLAPRADAEKVEQIMSTLTPEGF